MNKKELNDLIDRVVLTGPGGVDKIKKILKEIVNDSNDSDGGSSSTLFVHGHSYDSLFSPLETETTTWQEACDHFIGGGTVIFVLYGVDGGLENTIIRYEIVDSVDVLDNGMTSHSGAFWEKPSE